MSLPVVPGLGYCRGVAHEPSQGADHFRAAEAIGALCLATDLGMGFPFEHGLQSTLIAARLADRLGLDAETTSQTYYACMLSHAGCTTDAHVTAEVFGDSLTTHFNPVTYGRPREVFAGLLRSLPDPDSPAPVRALQTVRRLPRMARAAGPAFTAICEVAGMLAEGVGLPGSMRGLFFYLSERWDGKGPLRRARGEETPLPMRIVHVAVDATYQRMLGDAEHATRRARERAGVGLDPEIATCLADAADEIASAAAGRCRLDEAGAIAVGRAALVHDLGRVAIGARTWQKPEPLSADEWEQVRLHPYHTERALSRSPFLSALASVADAHHERLDGSGYHRGSAGAALSMPARLLAAADVYHAMCEPRPHREATGPGRAAEILGEE